MITLFRLRLFTMRSTSTPNPLQIRHPPKPTTAPPPPPLLDPHLMPANSTTYVWSRCLIFGPIFMSWLLFMGFIFSADLFGLQKNLAVGILGNTLTMKEPVVYGRPHNHFEEMNYEKSNWDLLISLSKTYVPDTFEFIRTKYSRKEIHERQNKTTAYDYTDTGNDSDCVSYFTDSLTNLTSPT
jgi:hypothetical protein